MSHKIWSNTDKNELHVKIVDIEIEKTSSLVDSALAELKKLKKDFVCILDITEVTPRDSMRFDLVPPDIIGLYSELIQNLIKLGMKKMVRVTDPFTYLLLQMKEEDIKNQFPVETILPG